MPTRPPDFNEEEMGYNGDDRSPTILAHIERQVASLKRELRGSRDDRYRGVWDHIDEIEGDLERLKVARDNEEIERRVSERWRKYLTGIVAALVALSGTILWIVYDL